MDTTHETLKGIRGRVAVPHSVPGLVTSRVLVMSYLDGVPLTQLGKYVKDQSPAAQKAAFKRVWAADCVPRAMNVLSREAALCASASCAAEPGGSTHEKKAHLQQDTKQQDAESGILVI